MERTLKANDNSVFDGWIDQNDRNKEDSKEEQMIENKYCQVKYEEVKDYVNLNNKKFVGDYRLHL